MTSQESTVFVRLVRDAQRDYREGWPLLTVETEANGGSKSTNKRGPSLIGSVGLYMPVQETFFHLGCSSRPSAKDFFFTLHYFNSFVSIAQQQPVQCAGSRAESSIS